MEDQREVQFDRAIEFAKSHNIAKVFETSAKTGNNVEDVFSCAGKELFLQTEKEAENDKETSENSNEVPGNKKLTKLGKPNKAGGQRNKKGGCC